MKGKRSANRARERHHVDPGSPRGAKCRRRRRHGRTSRVDVVHEDHVAADLLPCHERAAHVPTAGVAGEPRLARDPSPPGEKRRDRKAPEPSELAGERFGRLVPAPQAAIAVGRDIRDGVCRRPGHSPGDELGGQGRERAGSALLPAPYEGAGRIGVDDCRTGRREGEPPPGALAATIDRPGSVSAAAGAERRVNWHQPDAAARRRRAGRALRRRRNARERGARRATPSRLGRKA